MAKSKTTSKNVLTIPVLSHTNPCELWQQFLREITLDFCPTEQLSAKRLTLNAIPFIIIDSYTLDKEDILAAITRCNEALIPILLLGNNNQSNQAWLSLIQAKQDLLPHSASAELCRKSCLGFLLHYTTVKHQARPCQAFIANDAYTPNTINELSDHKALAETLTKLITSANTQACHFSLINIDIDNFKKINTVYGYVVGNQLIESLGQRLLANTRNDDPIFHLPGDKFIILLTQTHGQENAGFFAKRIVDVCKQAFTINDAEITIAITIGIACYPEAADNAEDLIKNAESATFYAKIKDNNTYRYFDPELHKKHVTLLKIENALYQAIDNHEFSVLYQPIVNLNTQRIVSMESLLRWKNPEFGVILPEQFMPLAEDAGLIPTLGQWTINTICQQLAHWQSLGFTDVNIAVDISLSQLLQDDFVDNLSETLIKYQLSPQSLTIQITESLHLANQEHFIKAIQHLVACGVQITISDFGASYAALSRLRHLPLSSIKIDQDIIQHLADNAIDQQLVITIIQLAHTLKLEVIAEGVKNKPQADFLLQHGCQLAQGFYFSKAIPADMMSLLLKKNH